MNMSNKVIKWGFIGCGNVTEQKSGPAFKKIEGSEVVAVMSRDAAILRACQEFGYTQTQIAAATGLHNSTVSKIHEVL